MKKELRTGLRTWIEIDTHAIAQNYTIFRSLIPKKTKLMAVVKSNAYGHGLITFSQEMEKLGTDYFGVDSIVEGIALRKSGIKKPILVLGYTLPEKIIDAVKNNIAITVATFETLQFLQKNNFSGLKIHIKIDTGMHRHGFLEHDMQKVFSELQKLKNVAVIGLFTHFASAKNPAFPEYTNMQIALFEQWKKEFEKNNYKVLCHASATSGTLIFPNAHYDMVRTGIGLYGIYPSRETKSLCENKFSLQPVLSWKTIIAEIKNLPAGSNIGYDGTEVMRQKSKIAICPIGYWHGYPRALSSIGFVLVNGIRCKILGRVCMDSIMIDITRVKKIKVLDEVALIGQSGKEKITADTIATLLDGSPYEIITRINPLVHRIYQ